MDRLPSFHHAFTFEGTNFLACKGQFPLLVFSLHQCCPVQLSVPVGCSVSLQSHMVATSHMWLFSHSVTNKVYA